MQSASEADKFLQQVIHEQSGSKHIETVIKGLQTALRQKGGLVASYYQAGQGDGLRLTRAAFAVMIKFQGLTSSLQELVEDIEAAEQFSLPEEDGKEKDDAVLQVIKESEKSDEILNCWQNATKMRQWLISKKQSISDKFEFQDDQ